MVARISQAGQCSPTSDPRRQRDGPPRLPEGQVPPSQQELEQTVHDKVGEVRGGEAPF